MTQTVVSIPVPLVIPATPSKLKTQAGTTVSIADLTDDQLELVGRAWAQQLLEHAMADRARRNCW